MINFHIIYLFIIIFLIYKSYKKEKINKINNIPTMEYYEWKRLFYKTMVLHEIKKIVINKKKWYKNVLNKSAHF